MKIGKTLLLLSITLFLLTACMGDAGDGAVEEMDFTEEEAALPPEEGLDFSDEEGLSVSSDGEASEPGEMVFDEDEAVDLDPEPEGMDFDEDEALDLNQEPAELYPPEGVSTWIFEHEQAWITCEGYAPIAGSPPESETLTITLGAEGASLVVSDLFGGNRVFYILETAGVGGATYAGFLENPSAGGDTQYRAFFYSVIDQQAADYVSGNLTAVAEGCTITRRFEGSRVD
jgi:hypothetical protein